MDFTQRSLGRIPNLAQANLELTQLFLQAQGTLAQVLGAPGQPGSFIGIQPAPLFGPRLRQLCEYPARRGRPFDDRFQAPETGIVGRTGDVEGLTRGSEHLFELVV